MFHPPAAFIGLRYARASKGNHFIAFINFFSVIGIALGLMALITVSSVMNGFEGQLKNRVLGLIPHLVVDTRGADTVEVSRLTDIPGVLASSPIIETEGVMQSPKDLHGVMIQGVEPTFMQQQSVVAQNMLFGAFSDLKPSEYGIVIGRALSVNLGLRPGDETRLIAAGTSVYTPLGRMPSQRIFKVVGIYDLASEMDNKVVFVHINDSARLLRTKADKAQKTRLFLNDAFEYKAVESKINFETDNWRARQGPLFDAVKMEKNMMSLMLLLIVAVAAFNIVSTLVIVVNDKHADIAILRTLGASPGMVMRTFISQGMLIGIVGTLLGVVSGVLTAQNIESIVPALESLLGIKFLAPDIYLISDLPSEMRWADVMVTATISFSLTVLATIYPAWRASRVQPAEALRYE